MGGRGRVLTVAVVQRKEMYDTCAADAWLRQRCSPLTWRVHAWGNSEELKYSGV